METDHKPLVPLLSSTDVSRMPPRRFWGSGQPTGSLCNRQEPYDCRLLIRRSWEETTTSRDDESFVGKIITGLPATPTQLHDILETQDTDEEYYQIKKSCLEVWPYHMPNSPLLRTYWENEGHLAVVDGLLLFDQWLVIPRGMGLEILDSILGNLGITKCQARARMSVWWPGITTAVTDLVSKRFTCAKHRPEPKVPLIPSLFPSYPWEREAVDLFEKRSGRSLKRLICRRSWLQHKMSRGKETARRDIWQGDPSP